MTIDATYSLGVFRPTKPVDLPENCKVRLHAEVVNGKPVPQPQASEARDIYEVVLGMQFESERGDLAARHNEHQP